MSSDRLQRGGLLEGGPCTSINSVAFFCQCHACGELLRLCTAGVSVFTRKMKLVVCHAKNIACYAQSWQLVQSWKKNEGPTNGSTDRVRQCIGDFTVKAKDRLIVFYNPSETSR